jgi:hypothetical protein
LLHAVTTLGQQTAVLLASLNHEHDEGFVGPPLDTATNLFDAVDAFRTRKSKLLARNCLASRFLVSYRKQLVDRRYSVVGDTLLALVHNCEYRTHVQNICN